MQKSTWIQDKDVIDEQVGFFKKPRLGVSHFTWRRPKKKKKKKQTSALDQIELSSTGL